MAQQSLTIWQKINVGIHFLKKELFRVGKGFGSGHWQMVIEHQYIRRVPKAIL